jgi:hypothetical protein
MAREVEGNDPGSELHPFCQETPSLGSQGDGNRLFGLGHQSPRCLYKYGNEFPSRSPWSIPTIFFALGLGQAG